MTRDTAGDRPGHCALCERQISVTFHHLIPRKVHRRTRFRKDYSRDERNRGIWVCRKCHNGIHRFYDEMTLAKEFASLAALQSDERLQKHIGWVRKQKD